MSPILDRTRRKRSPRAFVAVFAAAVAASAPAAASVSEGTAPAAQAAPDRDWTERTLFLGSLRWWADPAHVARLRALRADVLELRVDWAVPEGAEDGLTAIERDTLRDAKAAALREGAPGDAAGDAASAAAPGGYALRARVTEAWRPHRLLNVLIVALPGPSAPFMTQGGAAAAIDVVDAEGRAVAGFECRGYAGVMRFVHAFGRIGHPRGALQDCAEAFRATLRDGRLPDAGLAMTPGGATPVSAPAVATASALAN